MPPAAHLFAGGSRKQEMIDCKGPSSHRCEDLLPKPEVFWNLRQGHVSFLLSSFFTAQVSSTMGLPLHWVSWPSASVGASLSWAPAVLGLFLAEVVSDRLNPSNGTINVMRVYVPRFFVSSQQRFGATDIKALGASQLLGLGQTVL